MQQAPGRGSPGTRLPRDAAPPGCGSPGMRLRSVVSRLLVPAEGPVTGLLWIPGGVKAARGSPQLQDLVSPLTWAPWSVAVSPVFLFSISLDDGALFSEQSPATSQAFTQPTGETTLLSQHE
ncbi:glutaredoxin-like protein C5orf63 homolog isoform X1 [Motacilla alba alba]|uniref:glutaredoxin-like protein C5orf63 homolog isoform X1 n=1 Tax=Motacilla alba alba TaxID=1094192 RepID=UPI0018D52143|nr:glutaredoxin-like protein C5orf63 homolog isoform X1 [Motacilla alba alba]